MSNKKHPMENEQNQYRAEKPVPYSKVAGWRHIAVNRHDFASLMYADCDAMNRAAKKALPKLVFDLNGQGLSLAETDPEYRDAIERADYIHADGQSLVFASRIIGDRPLPERIATTDFFHDAAKLAEKNGLRFFLLGSTDETLNKVILNIRKQYPGLIIAGHHHGYFSREDETEICRKIVAANTDVLWVGLGKPKEQIFCVRNQDKLQGVAWLKTCGGLFDFLSDKNSRAPAWMQNAGLEWAYRLALEPRRLFWRYAITNVHSVLIFLRHAFLARNTGNQ